MSNINGDFNISSKFSNKNLEINKFIEEEDQPLFNFTEFDDEEFFIRNMPAIVSEFDDEEFFRRNLPARIMKPDELKPPIDIEDLKPVLKTDGVDSPDTNEGENEKIEEVESPQIINGVEYNFEYDYDPHGNVISQRVYVEDGTAGIRYSYDKDGNIIANLFEIDEKGNITEKWGIPTEAAEKIIERGLLNTPSEYVSWGGLANDIFVSEIWNISDDKWNILKYFFANISSDRIDLTTLALYGQFDIETIDKALYELTFNKEVSASLLYFKLSGAWSEQEFQNYLEENNIEYETYEEKYGKPYEYHPYPF